MCQSGCTDINGVNAICRRWCDEIRTPKDTQGWGGRGRDGRPIYFGYCTLGMMMLLMLLMIDFPLFPCIQRVLTRAPATSCPARTRFLLRSVAAMVTIYPNRDDMRQTVKSLSIIIDTFFIVKWWRRRDDRIEYATQLKQPHRSATILNKTHLINWGVSL